GLVGRTEALEHARAARRGQVEGAEVVLHGDGHPEQRLRAALLPAPAVDLRRTRLGPRAVEGEEGVQPVRPPVLPLDRVERGAHDVERGHAPGGYIARDLAHRPHVHAHFAPPPRSSGSTLPSDGTVALSSNGSSNSDTSSAATRGTVKKPSRQEGASSEGGTRNESGATSSSRNGAFHSATAPIASTPSTSTASSSSIWDRMSFSCAVNRSTSSSSSRRRASAATWSTSSRVTAIPISLELLL